VWVDAALTHRLVGVFVVEWIHGREMEEWREDGWMRELVSA
jgi:hypothetical protein